MRVTTTGLLAGAALLSLASCNKPAPAAGGAGPTASAAPAAPAAPLTAADLPRRKPGLWSQTMTMEGVEHAVPATEFCIDGPSEAKMSLMGQQMSRDKCQSPSFSRNLDGSITFTASCDFGEAGKSVSTGTISGDYSSGYKVAIDSRTVGGPSPGEHKMTIAATWEGPCKPGQKGGDIILPGGRTMNVVSGR
jgi:hypothetical protein